MNLFEFTLLSIIFIFFPLLLYLIYGAYSSNINKQENDLLLEFSLFSSLYLMIRYGSYFSNGFYTLILNVPLIIAYIKKRPIGILFLSVFLVFYYHISLQYSLLLLIIQYLFYMILYFVKEKNDWSDNLFLILLFILKSLFYGYFLISSTDHFTMKILLENIFIIILVVVATYISLLLLKKGEEIIQLHMTFKELEKEKQIQMSLFQITHEIKNPIAVCKGYLDMFDVNNIEHSKKYIPIMKEEIDRTLVLLQDFLSIQKIKIEKDILDLNLLLEETIASMEPLLKNKNIQIDANISQEELYINGDYNRLKQVFVNIMKNSIEAMTNSKKNKIKIEVKEEKNCIKVKVIDNGVGISKENLKKIKSPFFSTKQNGTGLGIYLSTQIIKAHDGKMEFESDEHGTTVTLSFLKEK